ncbi:MAG: CHASE domain-containing protein [Candidatus Omnitrophica bacterium]|nr:CHASE domain-containing protein [Candidatus Omnitrophota bacterium]
MKKSFLPWDADQQKRIVPLLAGIVMIAGIFIFGVFFVNARGEQADRQIRAQILNQAVQLARTINVDRVKALSWTAADKTNPAFQRMRNQFIDYGRAVGLRSVYTMAFRDGHIVFGPENIPESDPLASPPGTVYQEPRREDMEAFKTALPYTSGPAKDEYGVFVSAAAPVVEPRSGKVLMLVGIDIDAVQWSKAIEHERRAGILIVVILFMGALLLLVVVVAQRAAPKKARAWWLYKDVTAVLLAGCTVSAIAAFLVYEKELDRRHLVLQGLGNSQSAILRNELEDMRTYHLAGLVRMFERRENLSRQEFQEESRPLTHAFWLSGYGWAPRVPKEDLEAFEARIRQDVSKDFTLYDLDSSGKKTLARERPVHYPLLYPEPYEEIKSAIGFDLMAEPLRREALGIAEETGLPTATDPVITVVRHEKAIIIFQTVQDKGVVYLMVRPDALLRYQAAESGLAPGMELALFQAQKDGDPFWLASLDGKQIAWERSFCNIRRGVPGFFQVYPLMFFGKTYFLLIHSDDIDFARQLKFQIFGILLMGLGLSAVAAMVVGFMVNRQVLLEQEVLSRTAQIRESEEAYRRQFSDNGAPMFLIDAGIGRIIDVNTAAQKMYGYSREQLLTMRMMDINILPPAQALRMIKPGDGHPREMFEFSHAMADGTVRDVEVFTSLITWKGRPAIHVIVHDVTDRKKAERDLEQKKNELVQTSKLATLGEMAAGLAHEVNQPLGVISLVATAFRKLLEKGKLDEARLASGLKDIEGCILRMTRIVNHIRIFSRQEKPAFLHVDVAETIESALTLLGEQLYMREIEVERAIEPGLPQIIGEPYQLEQVWINFITNARDAMDEKQKRIVDGNLLVEGYRKKLTVSVSMDKASNRVLVMFADNGVGISGEAKEKAFNPFFTTKAAGKGTGLGLSISYGIIESHKGSITIEGRENEGACLKVYLPLETKQQLVS